MLKRIVYDDRLHVHFVTFSCYWRRMLLQQDAAKRIVIGQLVSRRGGTNMLLRYVPPD